MMKFLFGLFFGGGLGLLTMFLIMPIEWDQTALLSAAIILMCLGGSRLVQASSDKSSSGNSAIADQGA